MRLRRSLYPVARWYAHRFHHPGVDRLLRLVHPTEEAAERWSIADVVPFEKNLRLKVDTGNYLGWHLYFYGAYRPAALAAARASLRPGDVAVDVGAGPGDFTAAMASAVTASGAVHAFEPSLPEYQRCLENIELNGFKNVVLQQKAVSDTTHQTTLYGSAGFNQSISKLKAFGMEVVPFQCQTVTIDEYAAQLPRLDLIKLDSQGADLLVLQGARQTLPTHRPAILLNSVNEALYQRFGYSTTDLLRFLSEQGYAVRWLQGSSRHRLKRLHHGAVTWACLAYRPA